MIIYNARIYVTLVEQFEEVLVNLNMRKLQMFAILITH